MGLVRWTPLTFIAPSRYVDRDGYWADFDLKEWSRTAYEWTEDPWNGLIDFAQPPRTTVEEATGDCEDYALVAVAWAVAQDREGVGIAFCWESPYPWPRHVIAYDDDRVYSSGVIVDSSVSEWIDASKYAFCVRRRIR